MIRRQLSDTDMIISVVGLGAWAMGGQYWGEQDDQDSIAAIEAAADAGINWVDTAPSYGSGRSERVVGAALKKIPPARRPLVFSKFGRGDDSEALYESATTQQIRRECEASLKRLGIERIDLFQLHIPVPQPVEEVAGTCAELIKDGKIRAVGVSNFSVAQLDAWRATGLPLHAVQNRYSILRTEAAESVLPWCADHNVGFLAYSPLHRGMLFGNWKPDKKFPAGDGRAGGADFGGVRLRRHLDAIEELTGIAAADDMTCAQLCIGALLCTPGMTGCIVGARNAEQGRVLADLGMPISAKQLAAVEEIVGRLRVDLTAITSP